MNDKTNRLKVGAFLVLTAMFMAFMTYLFIENVHKTRELVVIGLVLSIFTTMFVLVGYSLQGFKYLLTGEIK